MSDVVSPTPVPERINYALTLDLATKKLILIGVLLGLFLAALDQTIVSTAMPRIMQDLNGLDLYAWVTTGYLLTNTTLVPIYGKLSDIYGRKPILMFGIVVFLLASALCGMSGEPFLGNLFGGGMMQLVVFRALQGIGAAALTSVAFAIIADLFEPAERARYQGLFGAVFGLSSVIGPLLGGYLTDHLSWRWVFYVNLPIGLLALAFIAAKMPRLSSGLQAKVDWVGALLVMCFTAPLLLALTWGADANHNWTDPLILGLFAMSAVSLVLFLLVERKHASPILPLTLFNIPTFAWGVLARFLIGGGFLGAILFLSLYLVQVQGVSATQAGVATIPLTLGLVFGAITSGQIAARTGRYKPLMLTGLVLTMLGFWSLSLLSVDTPYWVVIVKMVLLGLGLGPALPLYTTAIQFAVEPKDIGVATSAGQFFQQLGSTIGTALFGAVLTAGLAYQIPLQMTAQASAAQGVVAQRLTMMSEQASKQQQQGGQPVGEGSSQQSLPRPEDLKKGFDALRGLSAAALLQNDAKALQALISSAQVPEKIRNRLTTLQPALSGGQVTQARRALIHRTNLNILGNEEQVALAAVRATKVAFAQTISHIYLYCIGLGALAFLASLMMPDLKMPSARASTSGGAGSRGTGRARGREHLKQRAQYVPMTPPTASDEATALDEEAKGRKQ